MPSTPASLIASPRPRFAIAPATLIVVCAVALTILGLTILFSASVSFKQGPYYYLDKQLLGVGLAVAGCWLVSRLDLDHLRHYTWFIGAGALVLLVFVLVPHVGIAVKGSKRWLGLGPVRLQVSELAKFALVFCLAHYLALNQTRIGEFKRGFVYPLGIIGAFSGLILLEPDFGTAALSVAVGLTLLFLAGARWRYILPTGAGIALLFAVAVVHNPNRLRRFLAFLDVEGNKQGGTYQLYQALAAYASGGTAGVGLGQGRQQLNFLPEAHTDFIFAVVGEELGLVFTFGVVVVFAVIFWAGLRHLRRAPNLFQYLLVAGALLLICLQAIVNLGVVTGLFPTKGMSLPFISAGISNLLLMGLLVGIFVNTHRTWGRATLSAREHLYAEVRP
jgi:cell division protein FtsW